MSTQLSKTLQMNRRIVEARWPEVWAGLAGSRPPRSVGLADTPRPTLVIDGIHLCSGYQPEREAELQARLVPVGSQAAWIYGFGQGHLPAVLLKRPELEHLGVVIMSPAVAFQSLVFFDHTGWLADRRVELHGAGGDAEVQFPFCAAPACLRLASEAAGPLRDRVILELATPFINRQFQDLPLAGPALEEREALLAAAGDVAGLAGTAPGETILVAAAGPTLGDHFLWLRARRPGFRLIAVDAALKPLAAAGLLPDIVVSIDGKTQVADFFRFDLSPLGETPLVYFPSVQPQVLRLWPGPRLAAYPLEGARFDSLARRHPRGRLFSSGSVLHPALDLAVRMGAARVVLLGADFAFPRELSHVAGAAHIARVAGGEASPWVLDGHGQRILTRPDLRGFLRDLERYIRAQPQVKFINPGRDGAHIAGCVYLETGEL